MFTLSSRSLLSALLFLSLSTNALSIPQTCPEAVGPDIIVGALTDVANFGTQAGLDALSFGSVSCNLGDAVVDVVASTGNHDLLGQNLYRLKDHGGWFAMEQVGMSWLRHGFCPLNQNLCCTTCAATDCTSLGIGCSSPTSAGIAASQSQLGPRWEVDAHSSVFAFPPSNPPFATSTARRLQVDVADLEPTGTTSTRYFAELQVLAPGDALAGNGDNNASSRELLVTGSGSSWTFSFVGLTQRKRPAVLAWRDVDPEVVVTELRVPGEGLLILASRVTPLGGGQWHYEYALYNMNSHESVRSFSLPVTAATSVSDVGFHDVVYRDGDGPGDVAFDGTDWAQDLGLGGLTWELVGHYDPPGDVHHNALRWGTTYNFRFKADRAPTIGDVSLVTYRSETGFVVGGVPVPSAAAPAGVAYCDASDGALASCPCANPGAPDTGCDLAQGTGGVHLEATSFVPNGSGGGTATFDAEGFPPASSPAVVLIRSTTREAPAVVFGDGLLCVAAPVVRTRSGIAGGGAIQLNVSHGAGAGTFAYQAWFRNTPLGFCDASAAFNLSNGYELAW